MCCNYECNYEVVWHGILHVKATDINKRYYIIIPWLKAEPQGV